jgi:hypothetical protein
MPQLTADEYQAVRAAYLELMTGQEVARVVLPSGKRLDYYQRDITKLENLLNGYEMASGATACRVYAKHLRRR